MNTKEIFATLEAKKLNKSYFWRKEYDNGTTLFEYKLFEPETEKPFAFVQFGAFNDNGNLISLSVTSVDDMRNPIDCESMEVFTNVLDNLMN